MAISRKTGNATFASMKHYCFRSEIGGYLARVNQSEGELCSQDPYPVVPFTGLRYGLGKVLRCQHALGQCGAFILDYPGAFMRSA